MPITAAELNVKVSAQGATETQAALASVSQGVSHVQHAALGLAVVGGAAIAGIGLVSLHMAGDFQEGMTQLVTGAGESETQIGMLSQGILQLAVDTGTSTSQLIAGLYSISSAGFTGSQGLDVLRTAAEGAKVGNADLGTVAYALVGALNAYHLPATDAANVTNDLIATVANGNMHMQDLATSLGAIMAPAAALHVPLDQVSAAIDTMTSQSTDAHTATQSLRFLLASLSGPTSAAAKEMQALGVGESEIPGITAAATAELAKLGLHTSDVANTLTHQGLIAALSQVTTAIGKEFPVGSAQYNAALKAVVGGTRGMTAALELTGSNASTLTSVLGNIDAAVKKGAGSVTNWSLVQQDFNFKMSQAKEVVETLMISIGQKLLPVATALAGLFVSKVAPALSGLVNLISTNKDAFTVFAGIIGTVLVGALVAGAVAAWSFVAPILVAAAPVLAVVAAVAAVIVVLKLAYDHFSFVRVAVQSLMSAVTGQLLPALQKLWNVVGPLIIPILQTLGAIIGGVVVGAFLGLVELLTHVVIPLLTGLVNAFTPSIDGLKKFGTAVQGMAIGAANAVHGMVGFVTGDTKTMALKGAMHADELKVQTITAFIGKAKSVVQTEKDQRDKLLAEMAATTDPAKRHALAVKIAVITQAMDMHDKAIQYAESQRAKVLDHLKRLAEEAKHHADLMKLGWIGHVIEMKEQVVAWVENMAAQIAIKILDLKNRAVAKAIELKNDFIAKIIDLKNQAATEASNIVTTVMGFIDSLPGKLLAAGGNMIQSLVQGILGQLGSVKNAAQSIVSSVANFFPHSPAKEGPLRDLPNWGPRIVGQIAGGITNGVGAMRAATGKLTNAIDIHAAGSAGSLAVSTASDYASGPWGGNGNPQPIILQIDGRTLGTILMPYQVSAIRNNVGIRQ